MSAPTSHHRTPPGRLLEEMIDRAGSEVEEALYSADGIFARYLLRAV